MRNTDKYFLIRTSLIFGPRGVSPLSKKSFVETMLEIAERNTYVKVVEDEVNSVTYAPDLAAATIDLLRKNSSAHGVCHLTNSGEASWYEFAKEIFRIRDLGSGLLPVPSCEFPRKARRPAKAVLLNNKVRPIRPWREALADFLQH